MLSTPLAWIERPRLEADASVCVVIAPAGYGKTTFARQWAERRAAPVVGFNWRQRNALAMLNVLGDEAPEEADLETRVALFLDRIAGQSLALDDLQEVADEPSCRWLLDRIIEDGRIQLLLASRRKLDLTELERARGRGRVHALGPGELAFTPDELRQLLPDLDASDVDRVHQWSQGWAVLANLAGKAPNRVGQTIEEALDYVLQVVVSDVSPMEREVLRLCAAIPCPTDALLTAWIETPEPAIRNLVALRLLSREPERLRMHVVIREALRGPRDERLAIARRLADYGERLQAMEIFADLADWPSVINLLEGTGPGMAPELRPWLELIPVDQLKSHPKLQRWLALGRLRRHDTNGVDTLLREAEASAAERGDEVLRQQIALDRTLVPRIEGRWSDALQQLTDLEPSMIDAPLRVQLRQKNFLAVATLFQQEDPLGRAEAIFDEVIRRATTDELESAKGSAISNRAASVYRFRGRRIELEQSFQFDETQTPDDEFVLISKAEWLVEIGDPLACPCLDRVLEFGIARPRAYAEALALKAFYCAEREEAAEAKRLAAESLRYRFSDSRAESYARMALALVAAQAQNASEAQGQLDALEALDMEIFWRAVVHLTAAEVFRRLRQMDRFEVSLEIARELIERHDLPVQRLRWRLIELSHRAKVSRAEALLVDLEASGYIDLLAGRFPALAHRLLPVFADRGQIPRPLVRHLERTGALWIDIRTLDKLQIRKNGEVIPDAAWTRPRARHLFLALALSESRRWNADELIELLWPDQPSESSSGSFHTACTYVRKVLAPHELRVADGWLEIDPAVIVTVQTEHPPDPEALIDDPELARLWGQPILAELRFEPWAESRIRHWELERLNRLIEAAALANRQRRFSEALSLAESALLLDPEAPEAAIEVVTALHARGHPSMAQTRWLQFCEAYEEALGMPLGPAYVDRAERRMSS